MNIVKIENNTGYYRRGRERGGEERELEEERREGVGGRERGREGEGGEGELRKGHKIIHCSNQKVTINILNHCKFQV